MTESVAGRIIGLIDLTNLADDCGRDDVVTLCQRAHGRHGSVAAVCVWPRFVATAVEALRGTPVKVATVVNFPHGTDDLEDVLSSAGSCVRDGADEIDLVIPYRELGKGSSGDHAVVQMVAKVKQSVPSTVLLKTILETGELGSIEAIKHAAALCIASGADYIKTSTGKTEVSATSEAVEAMLRVLRATPRVDRRVGVKPSGGIRTVADARVYLDLADRIMGPDWATADTFRFGASGLLDAVESELA